MPPLISHTLSCPFKNEKNTYCEAWPPTRSQSLFSISNTNWMQVCWSCTLLRGPEVFSSDVWFRCPEVLRREWHAEAAPVKSWNSSLQVSKHRAQPASQRVTADTQRAASAGSFALVSKITFYGGLQSRCVSANKGEIWHASPSLLFTATAWKDEVFSFHNVLPGRQTSEGEGGYWEERNVFSLDVVDGLSENQSIWSKWCWVQ